MLAVAPDAASVGAAQKLAGGTGWSDAGWDDGALWGQCKGSGKQPYAVAIDLAGPAYRCSCPSRKFPCKHALGLLLRWAEGQVNRGTRPGDVAEWTGKRAERAATAAAPAPPKDAPVADPEAQQRRADERAARVAGGLDDLERWIADRMRGGLAQLLSDHDAFTAIARRMVDAQAPGLARRLEALRFGLGPYAERPARLTEELGLMHLLIVAARRVAADPGADPAFTATVRRHLGFPVAEAAIREREPVEDTWLVGDRRDEPDGHLIRRTTWLHGLETGRAALVLAFAPPGQPLPAPLLPGSLHRGPVHFALDAWPQRAVPGELGDREPAESAPAGRVDDALAQRAAALGADPWLERTAIWVDATLTRDRDRWIVVDELGDALPVHTGGGDGWVHLAAGGGRRLPHLLEWRPSGWHLLTVATWAAARAPEPAPW